VFVNNQKANIKKYKKMAECWGSTALLPDIEI